MAKKTGLTFEQHQRLGKELAALHKRIDAALALVADAYGTSGAHKDAALQIDKALKALDEARNKLDSLVFQEHRHERSEQELNQIYNLAAR